MSFHPELHFDYLHPKQWNDKPVKEIAKEVNDMEQRMKDSIGYTWGNSHIKITGLHGRPTITLQFYSEKTHKGSCNTVDLWSAKSGISLGSFSGKKWESMWSTKIAMWSQLIEEGRDRCNICGKWVKKIIRYSFAGGVCNKCYDPKKHLPPDTG